MIFTTTTTNDRTRQLALLDDVLLLLGIASRIGDANGSVPLALGDDELALLRRWAELPIPPDRRFDQPQVAIPGADYLMALKRSIESARVGGPSVLVKREDYPERVVSLRVIANVGSSLVLSEDRTFVADFVAGLLAALVPQVLEVAKVARMDDTGSIEELLGQVIGPELSVATIQSSSSRTFFRRFDSLVREVKRVVTLIRSRLSGNARGTPRAGKLPKAVVKGRVMAAIKALQVENPDDWWLRVTKRELASLAGVSQSSLDGKGKAWEMIMKWREERTGKRHPGRRPPVERQGNRDRDIPAPSDDE